MKTTPTVAALASMLSVSAAPTEEVSMPSLRRAIFTITTSGIPTASFLGSLNPTLVGAANAFDFNPNAAGGILARIISGDSQNNRVIDSTTGGYFGSTDKTAVFFGAGDVNAGVNPSISHIAYNMNVAGALSTQQFGIDTGLNSLVTVANNAGTLSTVGPLTLGGNPLDASDVGGFDIDGLDVAYAGFSTGTVSNLYTINTANGEADLIGSFGGNLVGLTAIPEPSSALLLGIAGLGMIGRRRR